MKAGPDSAAYYTGAHANIARCSITDHVLQYAALLHPARLVEFHASPKFVRLFPIFCRLSHSHYMR